MKTCLRMAAVVLSFALFIVCSENSLQAQGRRGGGSSQNSPARPHSLEERAAPAEFDDRPFDITMEQLPPRYRGHDTELIYSKITERKESTKKSEFESIERYRARVVQETVLPLTGNLNFSSIYAFRYKPAESFYSADKQILQVYCELSPVLEKGKEDRARRGFRIKTQPQVDNRYTYRNAYGAKVEIEEVKFQEYTLSFANFKEFPVERLLLPSVKQAAEKESKKGKPFVVDEWLQHEFILGNIRLAPVKAKQPQEGIMVLVICDLVDPYVSFEIVSEVPTQERLREYFAHYCYINGRLLELWFYDLETGNILMKMGPKAATQLQ